MRSKVVNTLGLLLVLVGVGIALAQTPPPGSPGLPPGQPGAPPGKMHKPSAEPSKLEMMLAEALKNNPDIRIAAANLTLADAELSRTRLQVTQKVLTLHHAILSQQATLDYEQKQYDRMKTLRDSNAISNDVLDEKLAKLMAAKAKLAELEAQVAPLLGKSSPTEHDYPLPQTRLHQEGMRPSMQTPRVMISGAVWERGYKPAGPMAEKIRKALQTRIKVDCKDMTFDAILNQLAEYVEGLSFRNLFEREGKVPGRKMSLQFGQALPVSAILQALADETGCVFFVRDYGIVATSAQHAPPGALTVEEFLRQKPGEEARPSSSSVRNSPAGGVEGVVKAVDGSGQLTISIGSDAGLSKGNTLQLFRLNRAEPKQSKYLGTIRILETRAKESVAQGVGRLADKPTVGDRVASHIEGN